MYGVHRYPPHTPPTDLSDMPPSAPCMPAMPGCHLPSSASICSTGGASSSEYSGSDRASGFAKTGRRSTRSLPSQPLRSRGVEPFVVGKTSSGPGMMDGVGLSSKCLRARASQHYKIVCLSGSKNQVLQQSEWACIHPQ